MTDRGAVQVQIAYSDGTSRNRQSLIGLECESLREMGQCLFVKSASERPDEDEIPTQIGGKLRIQ